jgi:hypothetical protein
MAKGRIINRLGVNANNISGHRRIITPPQQRWTCENRPVPPTYCRALHVAVCAIVEHTR